MQTDTSVPHHRRAWTSTGRADPLSLEPKTVDAPSLARHEVRVAYRISLATPVDALKHRSFSGKSLIAVWSDAP